jgi:hypothetical protein
VPPHIQPPIAQVPSPMREGVRFVPGIRKVSIGVFGVIAGLQELIETSNNTGAPELIPAHRRSPQAGT